MRTVSVNSFCVNLFSTRFHASPVLLAALLPMLSSCKKEAPEAGPRPPVPVTLGTVIQKDMPNHKEWIGNLQGTVDWAPQVGPDRMRCFPMVDVAG